MLAADLGLARKTQSDGRLLVVFVYTDDRKRADEVKKVFAGTGSEQVPEPIHGLPVLVETTSDPTLAAYVARVPAGVFLTQAPDGSHLHSLVQFGIANHIVVFSPFEGNVESGVLGGIAVEAQVRPFVNRSTLIASKVSLKEFFLKVAKVHE